MTHKLLSEEEIKTNFDVDYIRQLINYSLVRNPILTKSIISKPLYETENDDLTNDKYHNENLESLRDTVNLSEEITISKDLYEKLVNNYNRQQNNKL